MAGSDDPVDFRLLDFIVFLGFGVSEFLRGRAATDDTVTDRSLPLPVGRDIPSYLPTKLYAEHNFYLCYMGKNCSQNCSGQS